ncbi:MAG: hypothetical protein RMK18_00835 [Armatimonadota bacterium]|nr:hypothetical protein [Armatimonadota bacterium]MCX7777283.1 hypothetical protein [Armatimonadota bacterium]MDW8024400.1 hypothetical protein [Armatimonadota bacterium]
MGRLAKFAMRIGLVSAVALIASLSESYALPASGRKNAVQTATCEIKGCKCVTALMEKVDELSQRFLVAQHISGKLILNKLAALKRLYGSNFNMHKRIASFLEWLGKKPMCILITKPFDGEPTIFPGDGVTILGAVEVGATVTVNGAVAPLDKHGRFAVIAKLKPNDNRITICISKGELKKRWQANVPIKLDERLTLLDNLCKHAEAIGVQFEGARIALSEATKRASSGEYGRSDAERLEEIIHQLRFRLLQHRLGKCAAIATSSSAQLKTLWELARTFVAMGDVEGAERLLEQIEAYSGVDPSDMPCNVEPMLHNGVWSYSVSNGYVSAIFSRLGGWIADLRSFGIPMLSKDGIVDDLGDAAGRQNWMLIVEHASSELAILRAQTFVWGGIEFVRRVSLSKGSPTLLLHYQITNYSRNEAPMKWKLRIHPAIGYQGRYGNPNWDRLFAPCNERPLSIVISPGLVKGAPRRIPLKLADGLIGVHDSAYRAGFGVVFDSEAFDGYALIGSSYYALEILPKPTHSKLQRGKVEFTLALTTMLGCESYEGFGKVLRAVADNMREQAIKTTPFIGRPSESP